MQSRFAVLKKPETVKMAEESAITTSSEAKVCSHSLSSFLKGLIEDVDKSLQSANEEHLDFFKQCKEKCCHLLKSSQTEDIKAEAVRQILQEAAHVVLEYTYQDETLLVDTEFPVDSVGHRLSAIQDQLDKVRQVAEETFPSQPVVDTLGEEIVECLHWRKGALFYMYCHTLHGDSRPVDPQHYKQCLEKGVMELEKMLSTRQPLSLPSDISADDTLQLFSHGVYSDTHLLAMMYAAELCYWHQQAVDSGQFTSDSRAGGGEGPTSPSSSSSSSLSPLSAFSARQRALQHLDSYLAAVEGPLKGQGWSTDRATEFVQFFRHMNKD